MKNKINDILKRLDTVYNDSTLGDIPEIKEDIKALLNTKLDIPLSESDIQDLQANESFYWTFNDIDVHLFKANGLCEECGEEIQAEEGLCNDCTQF